QTPTLAILVNREEEIASFVPRDFWELEGTFQIPDRDGESFRGRWFRGEEQRIFDARELEELQALFSEGFPQSARIVSCESKERQESPPLLYDLTSLQRDANRRFSLTASRTLSIAQSLYEKHKIITYPRTDSRFLTPDLIPSLMSRLEACNSQGALAAIVGELKSLKRMPAGGRVINAARVRDHHAIIPTETRVNWQRLTADERRILELIHQAFLGIFLPEARWLDWEVITESHRELFRSKESQLVESGWRKILQRGSTPSSGNSDEIAVAHQGALVDDLESEPLKAAEIFSQLDATMEISLISLDAKNGVTRPPLRFSEGTLLSAMERAGNLLTDEQLKEAMRQGGLGTPATRAAIIERLKEVAYIRGQGKELIPTAKGIALIRSITIEDLRSPEMTGQWEAKLAAIEAGEYDPDSFMAELTALVVNLTAKCLASQAMALADANQILRHSADKATAPEANEQKEQLLPGSRLTNQVVMVKGEPLLCPLCQAPVMQNSKAYYCSRWKGDPPCALHVWKTTAGKTLTPLQVQRLLHKGSTGVLKGFRSKQGKPFSANLILDQGKVSFSFANNG
ncbi:MAG: DNA topoisomerase, partial [Symbiobacteriaceae bacterium]|nr:DNA topoisomerase [Symbiobacteriaceae bacterium]